MVVDGVEYKGSSVSIRNGRVFVDGVEQTSAGNAARPIEIVVKGDVASVDLKSGSVHVEGNAESVKTMSGNVAVTDLVPPQSGAVANLPRLPILEGLMARDRRRAQGTYFTPRELLQETVERALAAALSGRDAAQIRRIRIFDPAVGSGAFLLEALIQRTVDLAGEAQRESALLFRMAEAFPPDEKFKRQAKLLLRLTKELHETTHELRTAAERLREGHGSARPGVVSVRRFCISQ